MRERSYPVAPRGIATNVGESEVPPEYCLRLKNRFINAVGAAEKRQGIKQLGNDIPNNPEVTGLHELILKDGSRILMASTQTGAIFNFSSATGDWSSVKSDLPQGVPLESVQFDEKCIFYDGTSRNFWTDDGSTFQELKAIMNKGTLNGTTVSAAAGDDNEINDWVNGSFIASDDVLHNITLGAFGVITSVGSADFQHTVISTAGAATGLGTASRPQAAGDRYEILDMHELNVIPTDDTTSPDNAATIGPGSNATTVAVSGIDFSQTDVRVGDFVRNTTRTALAQVSAVATALTVTSVADQTDGDSIVLLKSAMPITSKAHVHFGRLYMVDARDKTKIRISGSNDPQDMSVAAGTLDATTFESGALQPTGDTILDMSSYQRYFMLGGRSNVYFFTGTDPIADTSAASIDFSPVGLFPPGS